VESHSKYGHSDGLKPANGDLHGQRPLLGGLAPTCSFGAILNPFCDRLRSSLAPAVLHQFPGPRQTSLV
jgi:hypothetical protein